MKLSTGSLLNTDWTKNNSMQFDLEPIFVVDAAGLNKVVRSTWKLKDYQLPEDSSLLLCLGSSAFWKTGDEGTDCIAVLTLKNNPETLSGEIRETKEVELVQTILTIADDSSQRKFSKVGLPWNLDVITLGNMPWIAPRTVIVKFTDQGESGQTLNQGLLFDSFSYPELDEQWLENPRKFLQVLAEDFKNLASDYSRFTSLRSKPRPSAGVSMWFNDYKPKNL